MKNTFRFLGILLVAGAMLFASCEKTDNDTQSNASQDNSGTNGNSPAALAANTLVYDGTTYHFDPADMLIMYYHPGLTVMCAYSTEVDGSDTSATPKISVEGLHIPGEEWFSMWNKTINLAALEEEQMYEFHISGSVLNLSGFGQRTNSQYYYSGTIDGVEYNDENLFTSGTYSVSGSNDGTPVTITLDATLKNGKTLRMKLVTGNYGIQ